MTNGQLCVKTFFCTKIWGEICLRQKTVLRQKLIFLRQKWIFTPKNAFLR